MKGNDGSLRDAASWLGSILTGPLVLSVCSIAIAALGLAMVAGRVDVRRGAGAIAGCFIVLGASSIANGLVGQLTAPVAVVVPAMVAPVAPQTQRRDDRKVDDPYAGASLAH